MPVQYCAACATLLHKDEKAVVEYVRYRSDPGAPLMHEVSLCKMHDDIFSDAAWEKSVMKVDLEQIERSHGRSD